MQKEKRETIVAEITEYLLNQDEARLRTAIAAWAEPPGIQVSDPELWETIRDWRRIWLNIGVEQMERSLLNATRPQN